MTRRDGVLVGNGHVTLHEPTASKPNYRLDYVDETGRRRQPSVGRSPAAALERAKRIDAALSRRRGGDDERSLGDLLGEYLSTPVNRQRSPHGRLTGRTWQPNQFSSVTRDLRRAVKGLEDMAAWQVDRSVIDAMRTACGTPGQVTQMTGRVRGFLRWCEEQGALSAEQVGLLPATLAPVKRPRFSQPEPRSARPHQAPLQGRSELYVDEEDCPPRSEVLSLAAELGRAAPSWGELAVHTAVAAGPRQGEQFQLRANDIRPYGADDYDIHIDHQWSDTPGRRAAPKHRKRRVVPISPVTRDGYPLLQALLDRAEQARVEQAEGRNPEALLFPAPGGGMWWPSGLSSDLLVPAMKAAGWTFTMVHETRTLRNGTSKVVAVTQMDRTWHSLRHRFARDMIDYFEIKEGALMAIGGWATLEVIQARYYRTGAEHVEMARHALGREHPES
ncbi:hypothetical protein [Cellulomonas fengjieae]|uniref:Tyr recombinase domain-containing protein n=1 Tax=Cellulomonas fengjieae TaxID=2819978 RepID=A0ABS3SEN9_9CELL|nr:hypothetical protein [Cellulomonas fengjieae]MBO3084122.1 hypothetical protein [Cellulomonas fengjieae]QVI64624.1 hypothetical protein KG102_10545 [Cellulomonas fengjieae]